MTMQTPEPRMAQFSLWAFTSRDQRIMRLVANRLAERFRNVYITKEGDLWVVELLIRWDVFEKDSENLKRGVQRITRRLWRQIQRIEAQIDETGELKAIPENHIADKVTFKPFM